MTRQIDQAITDLYYQLSVMSAYVEHALSDVITGLKEKDMVLLESVVKNDKLINEKERQIEQMCTVILSRYSPAAGDVREVTGVFKIITDLERIGDACADIAEMVLENGYDDFVEPVKRIPELLFLTKDMLKKSIDSYVLRDLQIASSMHDRDDEVDALYKDTFRELVDNLMKNPEHVEQSLNVLLMAKYTERIGDHCTNICEWIIYNIIGERDDIDSYQET